MKYRNRREIRNRYFVVPCLVSLIHSGAKFFYSTFSLNKIQFLNSKSRELISEISVIPEILNKIRSL